MRILCIQLKRIGDAILTAPALAALREQHPLARITLVLHGPGGQLAPAFDSVDEVLIYRPGGANVKLWARIVSGRWSACFDFTGTDRSALMARMSRAQRIFGFRKFAERRPWRLHCYTDLCGASVRELHTEEFFRALTGAPAAEDPGFCIPDRPRHRVEGLPERFVLIHPGTARPEKLWPAARWAQVIDRLELPVVVTGGSDAAERAQVQEILAEVRREPARVTDLCGRLSLLQLGWVISRSELVLTVDSAAMHLAAVARRPQVALFGPTNPHHWAPRHPQARIVASGGAAPADPRRPAAPMTGISVEEVAEAAEALLCGAQSRA